MLVPVLVIVVLIVLNGLFVAAEFAIIGAPRASIERRAAEGHRAARDVHRILRDPRRQDRYIATAQLGITFASLGLGMYGEHVVAAWIADSLGRLGTLRFVTVHAVSSILALAVLTYFHIVVGEMVPKSLALGSAERTVLWIARPMRWIEVALYPLVGLLNGIGNAILRLLGVRRELPHGHYHTPEELAMIVEESARGGLLRAESGRVLRELLEIGDRTARQLMTPRVHVIGVQPGAAPDEIAALLRQEPHTRYPVYEGDLDAIVGVVHMKDLLRVLVERRALARSDARPTVFVPATAELEDVLEAMRRARTQMVIVMDEHGGTAGVVSIQDLGSEAVGQIEESSGATREIWREGHGRWHAAGTARLDELGERLGVDLGHLQVETVSGLVLALIGRPANAGDVVSYKGVRLEVTAVEGRGVASCRVERSRDESVIR